METEGFTKRELKEISLFFRASNKMVKEDPMTPIRFRHKTSTMLIDLIITKHTENN